MEDKGHFSKGCVDSSCCWLSVFFMAVKLPGEGIFESPRFSEVSAFNQIMEALERPFSASVDSQLPSASNNPYAKVACSGWHSLMPFSGLRQKPFMQSMLLWVSSLGWALQGTPSVCWADWRLIWDGLSRMVSSPPQRVCHPSASMQGLFSFGHSQVTDALLRPKQVTRPAQTQEVGTYTPL